MSSVVRSVLGAAFVLAGASAAMAQTANAPAYPAGASAAPANAPTAYQSVQTSASAPIVASNNAPAVDQSAKPHSGVDNKSDAFGGHDPNSLAGARAFWEGQ